MLGRLLNYLVDMVFVHWLIRKVVFSPSFPLIILIKFPVKLLKCLIRTLRLNLLLSNNKVVHRVNWWVISPSLLGFENGTGLDGRLGIAINQVVLAAKDAQLAFEVLTHCFANLTLLLELHLILLLELFPLLPLAICILVNEVRHLCDLFFCIFD